ncbi:DUF4244 domain-containing protein [Phycicoccus sp.]|uniref:DUF4244 domain-containing protein n=1 Tax=Phycicoccus sp. TaxID=1902410 RepID=UPI002BFDE3D3|nr:DUF4244 domain-containing protein [Phycicoccus sp.]HMM95624.1 DUF4244 domain-containing protein [Phycicoccus sp.]
MTTRLITRLRAGARRLSRLSRRGEAGMTTAEYAVGTVAAVAFAALLLAVVKSGPVKSALTGIIVGALGT